MTLKIKKTHPNAVIPSRGTPGSAALDLAAALDSPVVIEPGKTETISTGIAVELPGCDTAALVLSRSGLGMRNGVSLVNSVGLIDNDYRGAISLCLINHSDKPFTVENGDRLAQLMVLSYMNLLPIEVEELSDTRRGEGGFGSTGIKELNEERG